MYGCESWTIKEAERWRIDALELWRWRWLLRVPWRLNQSILEDIDPEYSEAKAEATILWPPDAKRWLIWKDLNAESMNMSLDKLWELVMDRMSWRAAVHVVTKSWTQLSDWTKQMILMNLW